MLGVDENSGVKYTDIGGQPVDCVKLFSGHGFNCVRLRLWVNPTGQYEMVNNLAYDAAIAQRAKAQGMKVYLDFHYSDTWADPGNQIKPAAWANDTFLTSRKLYDDVFTYTANTIYTLATQYNVVPDYVSIGNEVTYGMLWPDGSLYSGSGGSWTNFATLLNEGIWGAQWGALEAGITPPKTIIHSFPGLVRADGNGFLPAPSRKPPTFGAIQSTMTFRESATIPTTI